MKKDDFWTDDSKLWLVLCVVFYCLCDDGMLSAWVTAVRGVSRTLALVHWDLAQQEGIRPTIQAVLICSWLWRGFPPCRLRLVVGGDISEPSRSLSVWDLSVCPAHAAGIMDRKWHQFHGGLYLSSYTRVREYGPEDNPLHIMALLDYFNWQHTSPMGHITLVLGLPSQCPKFRSIHFNSFEFWAPI